MKFVFICEFNKNVGLGHFDRCLNFADFLRNNDHECSFLTFNSEKKLIKSEKWYQDLRFFLTFAVRICHLVMIAFIFTYQ